MLEWLWRFKFLNPLEENEKMLAVTHFLQVELFIHKIDCLVKADIRRNCENIVTRFSKLLKAQESQNSEKWFFGWVISKYKYWKVNIKILEQLFSNFLILWATLSNFLSNLEHLFWTIWSILWTALEKKYILLLVYQDRSSGRQAGAEGWRNFYL